MATAAEIITRALRRAGVIDGNESAAADMSADALEALNHMLAAWEADGIEFGHYDLALSDALPLEDKWRRAVVANLAIELCDEYQRPVAPLLAQHAEDGKRAMQAHFAETPESRIDRGLLHMPSQRWGRGAIE